MAAALARVKRDLSDTDGAFADCELALKREPGYAQAYAVRSDLWDLLGKPVEAEADMTRAIDGGDTRSVCYAISARSESG